MKLRISDETRATAVEMKEAIADQEAGIRGWSRYPHLVLRHEQFLWTSVHVALVKSGLSSAEWRRRAPGLPPTVSVSGEDEETGVSAGGLGAAKAWVAGRGQAEAERASRSARTIRSTSSSKPTRASQPSSVLAFVGVRDDLLDVRGPDEVRVDPDVVLAPQADGGEGRVHEVLHGMGDAGPDHEVAGCVLLEHQPHRLDVLLRVAPVAAGLEVAEDQLVRESRA